MLSKLTKNNPKTLDKAILKDNLKEISLSDESGIFSNFPESQEEPQTQADSTTSDNELGRKNPNSMQIYQEKKLQTTKPMKNQLKLFNDDLFTKNMEQQ